MASQNPLQKLNPAARIAIGVAVIVIAAVIALARGCKEQPAPSPDQQPPAGQVKTLDNWHIRFGMPIPEAKTDPASKDAYLIDRPQYVLSYNDSTKTPNWVCWNLNKGHIAKQTRPPSFEPDPLLPKSFTHVKHSDYTGSGFDRGHMCPSKDRTDTPENNAATFYTTNIVPQAPKCNQGGWERFEDYCRRLTDGGAELFIACGPHGQGGTGTAGPANTIGKGAQVTVPAAVWKVVLVLPNRDALPTAETRSIAVWMPNDQSVPEDFRPYVVSVADVEKRTGHKFFPLVPDDIAGPIKARVDKAP